jgi:glycosyltransferase involved in cell wall biosynthesis
MKKLISVVIPCFNEEKNIDILYKRLSKVIEKNKLYKFEIIFIDNSSVDNTQETLRKLAKNDKKVKLIFNTRNFGPSKSPIYGLKQSSGDASILICADMQEPPEIITELIKYWEKGWNACLLVRKTKRKFFEKFSFSYIYKNFYYSLISKFSHINLVKNTTGNGLYDKKIIDKLKQYHDHDPYLRGFTSDLGYPVKEVLYDERQRKYGKSKHNFYSLYEEAMRGIVSYTVIPLRIICFLGFLIAFLSFLSGFYFLIRKLMDWQAFDIGIAPLIIFVFFLFGVLFIYLGIISEFIANILINVKQKPLVEEKERINF